MRVDRQAGASLQGLWDHGQEALFQSKGNEKPLKKLKLRNDMILLTYQKDHSRYIVENELEGNKHEREKIIMQNKDNDLNP